MFYVQMAFLIFLLISAIITSISYSSRRSKSKSAYSDLAQTPIIRQATEEEKAALKPILSVQKMELSYNVYHLSGYYLCHGVETNNNVTEHHTIGDVEVFLPYDANSFLLNYNEAEVILGPTFAVVLTLNGAFDLATARTRIIQQQLTQQALAKQTLTQTTTQQADDTSTTEPLASHDQPSPPLTDELTNTIAYQQSMEVTELAERQETALESLQRLSGWGLFWCFVAWLITLIILGNSLDSVTNTGFIWALIGVLSSFGLFWFYRPARLIKNLQKKPQTIKNVVGQLNLLKIASPNNAHQINDEYFIGDEMKVTIPDQWKPLPLLPLGRVVNADIRTEDNYVVRLDNWKIADEYQQFPPIYKGRYIFLMILGGFSLFCYWLADGNPPRDLNLAKLQFTQQQVTYQSAEELLSNLPKTGSIVTLSGKAKCLLTKTNNNGMQVFSSSRGNSGIISPLRVDCRTIHWGGQPLTLNNFLPTNDFKDIYSGDFIDTKIFSNYVNYHRVNLTFLQNPPQLVERVEKACQQGFPDCQKLKQAVVDSIKILAAEQQPDSWQAFVNYTKTWQKDTSRLGLDTQVRLLSYQLFNALSQDEMSNTLPQLDESLTALINSQQGGIFINDDNANSGPTKLNTEYLFNMQDLASLWHEIKNITDRSFSITGMVTHIEPAVGQRDPFIYLDTNATLEQGWSACNYSLWFIFSLLMLGYGGVMFFTLPSLRKRKKALNNYLLTREYHP